MNDKLKKYFSQKQKLIDKKLKNLLPSASSRLTEAMLYSLLAGGKRLRPILALMAAEICGKNSRPVLAPACAIEMIHTYSLIHDDLPAMDDDDLRRGKPTSHKKFGEAAAILAGDALLTDAFLVITENSDPFKSSNVIRAISILSKAAGSNGMVLGQMMDTLESEGWQKKPKNVSIKNLELIHRNKTAALIKASLEFGAVISGASTKQLSALGRYGSKIGLAFQIADDILDLTGDKKLLGKKGSDLKNKKLTYPALYGLESSRQKAVQLIASAKNDLKIFGNKAELLIELADYILSRDK